jgi:hypothetical protein
MYVDGKMRPVETIPAMGEGGIKENDRGVNSTTLYCKNFCKYHKCTPSTQMYAQYSNKIRNFWKYRRCIKVSVMSPIILILKRFHYNFREN